MASVRESCEKCGERRVLTSHHINQFERVRWCKRCVAEDSVERSEAAIGKAGRPPKRPSSIEDQVWRFLATAADSRLLEAWLASEGFTGTRGQMLKAWALKTVERQRKR